MGGDNHNEFMRSQDLISKEWGGGGRSFQSHRNQAPPISPAPRPPRPPPPPPPGVGGGGGFVWGCRKLGWGFCIGFGLFGWYLQSFVWFTLGWNLQPPPPSPDLPPPFACPPPPSPAPTHLVSAHVRHHNVQQDDVGQGGGALEEVQSLRARHGLCGESVGRVCGSVGVCGSVCMDGWESVGKCRKSGWECGWGGCGVEVGMGVGVGC